MNRTTIITVIICILLAAVGLLGWVYTTTNPLSHPLARWVPVPLACTTRGCITSWSLQRHLAIEDAFSASTKATKPTEAQMLTTLIRQFLVHKAEVRSPISLADARRYREEILKVTDEIVILNATGLTLDEYDNLIVSPFLEQENLRQARHAETTTEVFRQLAAERWVVVLPVSWYWDSEAAEVRVRD